MSSASLRSNCSVIDRSAGRAGRRHLVQPRHLAELALERRGDRRGHHLRAGAGIERQHADRRIVDLGQRRQRQEPIGDHADHHDRDHQQRGRDGTLDEDARRVHVAAGVTGWSARADRRRRCRDARRWRPAARPACAAVPAGRRPQRRAAAVRRRGRDRPADRPPARTAGRRPADLGAVAQAVDAVDHHLVADLEALGHGDLLAVGDAGPTTRIATVSSAFTR